MTKEEIRKASSKGLSEDLDGEFYTIYDFDKICQLITEEFKGRVKSLPAEFSKVVDENFWDLV